MLFIVCRRWNTLWLQHSLAAAANTTQCLYVGVLVFGAILYSRLLRIPLLVSYHTHIPFYIPIYTCAPPLSPFSWPKTCSRT